MREKPEASRRKQAHTQLINQIVRRQTELARIKTEEKRKYQGRLVLYIQADDHQQ